MAARADWRGAVSFCGFPIPLMAFKTTVTRKGASFKQLDPKHKKPVKQQLVDVNGTVVDRGVLLKGVEAGDGTFKALTAAALELIEKRDKSDLCEIERFSPVDTVPWEMGLDRYVLDFNTAVPGAEGSVQQFWNILRAWGRAAIIQEWTPRAGAKPSILAVRATESGLEAFVLPFLTELKEQQTFTPAVNEKAQAMAMMLETQFPAEPFDHTVYLDGQSQRRERAIELALSGEELPEESEAEATPAPAVPDLLAALEATLAAGSAEAPVEYIKKPARKRTTKKAMVN